MPTNSESMLIASLAAGDRFGLFKATQAAEGSGTWLSMWRAIGFLPASGIPPAFSAGSGYVPTRAIAGAIPVANPVSPTLGYLGQLAADHARCYGRVAEIPRRYGHFRGFEQAQLSYRRSPAANF